MSTQIWQLRTPEGETINDLVRQLAQALFESVEREIDSCETGLDGYQALVRPVLDALYPYVKAYNACGKDVICTAAIEDDTWVDFRDQIYIMELPAGVNGLVEEVSNIALRSYSDSLDESSFESLKARTKSTLHSILIRHLYWNPQCGSLAICMLFKPVDPWGNIRFAR